MKNKIRSLSLLIATSFMLFGCSASPNKRPSEETNSIIEKGEYPIDSTVEPTKDPTIEPTYDPTASDVYLSSIAIISLPNKTTYSIGESFDPAGLRVKAIYSNRTEQEIYSYTVSAPDMSSKGTKKVTISYQNKSTSFNITVNENTDYDSTWPTNEIKSFLGNGITDTVPSFEGANGNITYSYYSEDVLHVIVPVETSKANSLTTTYANKVRNNGYSVDGSVTNGYQALSKNSQITLDIFAGTNTVDIYIAAYSEEPDYAEDTAKDLASIFKTTYAYNSTVEGYIINIYSSKSVEPALEEAINKLPSDYIMVVGPIDGISAIGNKRGKQYWVRHTVTGAFAQFTGFTSGTQTQIEIFIN